MARKVAELTGLPWHPVDELTWEPGWVAVPPDEQRRRIAAICAGEQWVLDSAYGTWRDVVLARAARLGNAETEAAGQPQIVMA